MLDYFDRIESELRRATAHAPVRAPRRRANALALVAQVVGLVLAAAVALAIVVLAGHRPYQAATTRTASRPASVSPQPCIAIHTPRCLLEQYQLVRRPQTAAERAIKLTVPASAYFAGQALHDVRIALIPALTRRVDLGQRDKLIVFVFHSSLGPPDFYLGAKLITPTGSTFLPAQWPFIATGPRSWSLWATRPTTQNSLTVAVLPDRVATVRWAYPRAGTRTIRVHNNIALTTIPPNSGDPTITEYGPTGHILAHTPTLPTSPPPIQRHHARAPVPPKS